MTNERIRVNRNSRQLVAMWMVLAGLVLMLGRMAWIQGVQHDKWARMAREAHFTEQTIQANRGMILDCNRKSLAVTCPIESVFANPRAVANPTATAHRLARLLGVDEGVLRSRLARSSYFVWVKRHVTEAEAAAIRRADIAGVGFRKEYDRRYATGALAGHVTGFVNIDNVGQAGIEKAFNDELAGKPGREVVRRDGLSRTITATGLARVAPVPGRNVVLSIDSRVQAIAREEVKATVENWKAEWGIAVAMQPHTGDVLGLVSYPDYDPNTDERADNTLTRNHAVSDWFEPGSTMKPFTAAALLQSGRATLDTRIFCHNGFHAFGAHRVHDVHGYGWLTLKQVVVKSSNIGICKAAEQLGADRLHTWLRRFGFGRRAGLEIPGESAGLLRPTSEWSGFSMSSIPMGHEMAATGIQLARGFCVFANGGYLVKPRLVIGTTAHDGRGAIDRVPCERTRVLSREVAETLCADVLTDVVNIGTARRAQLDTYQVAGKTGTAQIARRDGRGYEDGAYVALFAGMAPAEADRKSVV